jgi:hypothetical protein
MITRLFLAEIILSFSGLDKLLQTGTDFFFFSVCFLLSLFLSYFKSDWILCFRF